MKHSNARSANMLLSEQIKRQLEKESFRAENNPKQKRRTPSWCAQLPNRLGRRMTEYCLRKGWSLYVLSAASGVPLTTIAHIADGSTKNPGIYTIMRICRALDVPLAVFLDGLEDECGNE